MIRLLVSVRDPHVALVAARGGADFIDLKEPGQGALGGLPVPVIERVVAALRGAGSTLPVSATIGDVPMAELASILDRVAAVGATGVDYVKGAKCCSRWRAAAGRWCRSSLPTAASTRRWWRRRSRSAFPA